MLTARVHSLLRRDPALLSPVVRVLQVMEPLYNEVTPVELPAWFIGEKAGVKRRDVWRHWDTLVAWGVLVEHPRTSRVRARCFTLAPDREAALAATDVA